MSPTSGTVELRLRAAVESSPSGILMIDADGRIVLVNREVERLFGYAREELLGRPVEMLVPARFRQEHPGHRTGFLTDPRVRAMGAGRDLYGLRKDGSEVPVEIGLTPVVTDEGMFVLSAVVDISARKQAEEEHRRLELDLRQAQKMDAVGRLAGGIAHDFNNILGAIVGYGELIGRQLPPEHRIRPDLDELLRASERGRELVQRILTVSRRQEKDRRPLALGPTVRDAIKLLRATLPAIIEIQVEVHPETPRVLGDGTALHQVLMNLATNAADAMPAGGTIRVQAEPFYVRDSIARANPDLHEGPYGLLTVHDEGQGMPPEVLERAFEPFFTTKEIGAGTGLGLAMVHAIMRDHEGTVRLESDQGTGTVARCYFPALESEGQESPVALAETPTGNGERILYVDDELALTRVGERQLTELGYHPTVAQGGEAALARFEEDPSAFDLVVTDYSMPKLTGLELAQRITARRPGLPIIMLTGFVEDLPADALQAAGIRWVRTKPMSMSNLALVIREALTSVQQ